MGNSESKESDELFELMTANLRGLSLEQQIRLNRLRRSSLVIEEERRETAEVLKTPYRSADTYTKLVGELRLQEGYADAKVTQKDFGLVKDIKIPDFDTILRTFTLEMLQEAEDFQNPGLVLCTKGKSFRDLVLAMDNYKGMLRKNNTSRSRQYGSHERYADQKPRNWSSYIIEAPTEMGVHYFDTPHNKLKHRIENFANYKKVNGVGGMDCMKYAHLAMQRFQSGYIIDQDSMTLLDENSTLPDNNVPCASWYRSHSKVDFNWLHPEDQDSRTRFRRSVGGIVPNS